MPLTHSSETPIEDSDIPHEFICPILLRVMTDPVQAPDGHTYEREAISEWFSRNDRSPITRARYTAEQRADLRPNISLKKLIDDYRARYPHLVRERLIKADYELAVRLHEEMMQELEEKERVRASAAGAGAGGASAAPAHPLASRAHKAGAAGGAGASGTSVTPGFFAPPSVPATTAAGAGGAVATPLTDLSAYEVADIYNWPRTLSLATQEAISRSPGSATLSLELRRYNFTLGLDYDVSVQRILSEALREYLNNRSYKEIKHQEGVRSYTMKCGEYGLCWYLRDTSAFISFWFRKESGARSVNTDEIHRIASGCQRILGLVLSDTASEEFTVVGLSDIKAGTPIILIPSRTAKLEIIWQCVDYFTTQCATLVTARTKHFDKQVELFSTPPAEERSQPGFLVSSGAAGSSPSSAMPSSRPGAGGAGR